MIQAECGVTVQDFGDQVETECPRGVNGVVWNDLDGDGELEIGEPPLAGATLTLQDGNQVQKQITGVDGIYLFENLDSDVYTLIEENPPSYPISTTIDNRIVDLLGCNIWTILFGDRAASGQ